MFYNGSPTMIMLKPINRSLPSCFFIPNTTDYNLIGFPSLRTMLPLVQSSRLIEPGQAVHCQQRGKARVTTNQSSSSSSPADSDGISGTIVHMPALECRPNDSLQNRDGRWQRNGCRGMYYQLSLIQPKPK